MISRFAKLGAIAKVTMGTSPKGHFYNDVGDGCPLLNGPTEFGPIFPLVTLFTTKSLKECQADDLLFCVRGSTTGRMNWADQTYSIGRGICSIRGHNVVETKFIRYAIEFRLPALLQLAGGSTFPNLPTDTIKEFDVPYPENRNKISSILSAYDDLIENNLRRIKLLEESARQLYKEWFVRLRFPGYEHTNIIKGVPDGWEKKTIKDVASLNENSLPSSFNETIEYVDISSVTPDQISNTTTYEFKDAPSRARRIVKHGDVIWSCVRPNRRSHAIIWNPIENLIVSTGFAVLSPTIVPCSYLYYYTTTNEFVGYLEKRARGVAYPAVKATDFEDAEIIVPSESLLKSFDEIIGSIFEQKHNLFIQNRKLKQARYILLPKLMSGEVEV